MFLVSSYRPSSEGKLYLEDRQKCYSISVLGMVLGSCGKSGEDNRSSGFRCSEGVGFDSAE